MIPISETIRCAVRGASGDRLCCPEGLARGCAKLGGTRPRCYCEDVAGAALRALEAAGYAVVPVKPTDAMLAVAAMHDYDFITREDLAFAWSAMIASARKDQP